MAARQERTSKLRARFLAGLKSCAPWHLLGPVDEGLTHTLLVAFPSVRADMALMALDLEGVACSTGSACSSGSMVPSPALALLDIPAEWHKSVIRFSLSPFQDETMMDEASRIVSRVVHRLREAPP
jgi:cysteine desulfurase